MTGEWKEVEVNPIEGRDDWNLLSRQELELERLNQNFHDETGGSRSESETGDESESEGGYALDREKRSIKGPVWIVLATVATSTGRRLLRDGFPYPFYFVFLLLLAAYCSVAVVVIFIQLGRCRRSREKGESERHTISETFINGLRLCISASFSALSMLCGATALMLYNNLSVLALLPILTYACDSIVLRLLHILRITRRENLTLEWIPLLWVLPISLFAWLTVYEDYRLEIRGIIFAIASFVFSSFAILVPKIGPRIEKGPTSWSSPLYVFLGVGIPLLLITHQAAAQYEDLVAASHITNSWSIWSYFMNLSPGALLYILFNSGMNSAYPYSSQDVVGGALDDPGTQSQDAVRSTLHSGVLIIIFGVFGKEYNFIDWVQAFAFTLIYVVGVGPEHIGYYPPRLVRSLTRIVRKQPQQIRSEPWQIRTVLFSTTTIFTILVSCNAMYLIDTIAYSRSLKDWSGPALKLDIPYRPPKLRTLDIIVAHSDGDPIESIKDVIAKYTSVPGISGFGPRVTLYTKQPNFDTSNPSAVRGSFGGQLTIKTLNNTGGVTATYLHHILSSWDTLSQQNLFVSTTISPSSNPLDLSIQRLNDYFIPAGFPLPDALPKTGFLNLGGQETCSCDTCKDALGWEDTFRLVPSMWSAVRPGDSYNCNQVLLTLGNNFVASASRIRGVPKDVWQVLYDGLTMKRMTHAWAHDKVKFPQLLEGQKREGRWHPSHGVYGQPDSLEKPLLGLTVERIWAVLLQCSTPEIAWGCPPPGQGYNLGGRKEDCTCIDEASA